jgi:hypothetical protein
MATWREQARPIIETVIRDVGTSDMKALKAALRDAYPFGLRAYHPYRIWCHEVRVQLGQVVFPKAKRQSDSCDGQVTLWEE